MTHPPTVTETDTGAEELIARGMAHLRAGDAARAQQALGQAVRHAPGDERGWLGLALALAEPERRAYCLKRCLSINPDNRQAQQALAALQAGPQPAGAAHEAQAASRPAAPEPTAAPAAPRSGQEATTPLAARLAAAAAKRGGETPAPAEADAAAPPEPQPEAPIVQRKGLARIQPIATPPLLQPLTLSQPQAGHERASADAGRLRDEEIAEAALRQLLRQGPAPEQDARASSAASIAQRYFGSSHGQGLKEPATPAEALRALGMAPRSRHPARVAVLALVLLLVIGAGVLLLIALLSAR